MRWPSTAQAITSAATGSTLGLCGAVLAAAAGPLSAGAAAGSMSGASRCQRDASMKPTSAAHISTRSALAASSSPRRVDARRCWVVPHALAVLLSGTKASELPGPLRGASATAKIRSR